jgi:uncharacterized protein
MRSTSQSNASHRLPGAPSEFLVKAWETPHLFLEHVGPILETHEAEHSLILGLCADHGQRPTPVPWLLLSIEDGCGVVGAAIRTPGQRVSLTRMPPGAIDALVRHLSSRHCDIPGVTGSADVTATFAQAWSQVTERPAHLEMKLRLYDCRAVTPPAQVPGGPLADRPWLVDWLRAFQVAVGHTDGLDRLDELAAARINAQKLWLWCTDGPVSCAGYSRVTRNGVAINFVYTPPEFRRRGYAGACVAALTQHLLDSGRQFCCLYTDLANPTSNHIYQQIGYRLVCDAQTWRFTD